MKFQSKNIKMWSVQRDVFRVRKLKVIEGLKCIPFGNETATSIKPSILIQYDLSFMSLTSVLTEVSRTCP